MNHSDHVRLIRAGVIGGGGVWADLGSGSGAFTLALADLLGAGGHICSVDTDTRALREQRDVMQARFPAVTLEQRVADFAKPLDLRQLDGIVMANSLHFQRRKELVLHQVRGMLKPGGRLVLVEYNADKGNIWVPFPLSYPTWQTLSLANGFVETRLLTTVPSRFLREIYSAVSFAP
ncbi:MAG TPA: class I SAM-dependent methyltransferase [Ktedonobacterales bacterium]|nr:class I SAM-dependent methyltransferase [Ktedonobacterales bacterium]